MYQRYQSGEDETGSKRKQSVTGTGTDTAPLMGADGDFQGVVTNWAKDRSISYVADCAIKVKKFGVDFWEQKTAVLIPDQRVLILMGVEPKVPGKANVAKSFPPSIAIPLIKFTLNSGKGVGDRTRSSMSHTKGEASVASNASATPTSTDTTITITHDSSRSAVIQFTSSSSMAEFGNVLKKIVENKWDSGASHVKATSTMVPEFQSVRKTEQA
ncbi:hypothetical protein HK101_003878 [Irineochytrium annulatum]|nr:hypothetical protein HK101_003878 [Irineochytrium annulatum]